MDISRDDIRELKLEGWTFRVKTVKGCQYITRRKGRLERGMGRFTGGLWSLIEDTKLEAPLKESKLGIHEYIKESIVANMSLKMYKTCTYNIEGYCHFIEFDFKKGLISKIEREIGEEGYKMVMEANRPPYWVFKTNAFYCENCPAYKIRV